MKRRWTVRGGTIAVIAVFGGMLFPGPAGATPLCHGWVGTNENTIGVGGDPITSTPEFHFQVCVDIEGTPTNPSVPTPTVECITSTCPNFNGTWITFSPYDTGAIKSVTVNYTFDGDFHSETVPLPDLPTSGTGGTCVFYIGRAINNPGGCLLFFNHGL